MLVPDSTSRLRLLEERGGVVVHVGERRGAVLRAYPRIGVGDSDEERAGEVGEHARVVSPHSSEPDDADAEGVHRLTPPRVRAPGEGITTA